MKKIKEMAALRYKKEEKGSFNDPSLENRFMSQHYSKRTKNSSLNKKITYKLIASLNFSFL